MSRYHTNPEEINSLEIERIVNEHSSLVEHDLGNYILKADDGIILIDQLNLL